MEITDVRIRKIATEGKMKAIVSITFDNEFVVHDIKVIEGQSGLFIAMPSRKTPDGEFKDIAHPINTGTREKIQAAILSEYEKVKNEEPVVRKVIEKVEEKVEENTEEKVEV
ncbi:MAG: septation regulator SpoVG [Clostridium sp.]